MVYYNEIDPFCCEWLAELMKRGLVPEGEIDNRSIEDVKPSELTGFTQCHFFAGIAGWAYALRCAGWPDDRPVWTGSCPCQPFSAAGKRKGASDERHLWPSFFWLISQCKPDTIIGEQVASKDALAWCDLVRSDVEGEGYAFGVCDTCAAGYGAPHIRQRLYWLAVSEPYGWRRRDNGDTARMCREIQIEGRSSFDGVANAAELRPERCTERTKIQGQCPKRGREYTRPQYNGQLQDGFERCCRDCRVDNTDEPRLERYTRDDNREDRPVAEAGELDRAMPTNGFWANPDWLWCRDKKWRPIESGTGPLVDGLPKGLVRGGDFRAIKQRLRGYGNAIVIPQAVEFIKAVMETI